MDMRNNFFTARSVRPWHRLPRDLGKSPSLGVFKNHVDVALQAWLRRSGSVGLEVGLDHLRDVSNIMIL